MGKIVISENISLDGVINPTGEDGFGRWFAAAGDKNNEAWATVEFEEAMSAEALLMGRRSYEWFLARGWASRTGAWADRLRELPKYVVSSTALDDPEWTNSTVMGGDVAKEVSTLRHRVDGDIVVYGSGRLVRTLLATDLVDELRLMTYPVVAGVGERLFGETTDLKTMRLTDTRTVGTGLILLTYQSTRDSDAV